MNELLKLSISEILSGLSRRQFSVVEITNAYLNAVEKTKDLNMYLEVTSEKAIQMAKESDLNYKNDTTRSL